MDQRDSAAYVEAIRIGRDALKSAVRNAESGYHVEATAYAEIVSAAAKLALAAK